MKSLHDEIMNLKIDDEFSPARVNGFSIARRMSAELATKHDALMDELLEALEAIIVAADDMDIPYAQLSPHLSEPARKAIAKAKGEVK